MKRREFLALTAIISTSCSSLSLFSKKEIIIYLDENFPQDRAGSDGRGSFYPYQLNSNKEIYLKMNLDEINKYLPGDCLRIIREKYPFEGTPAYKIIEKIN